MAKPATIVELGAASLDDDAAAAGAAGATGQGRRSGAASCAAAQSQIHLATHWAHGITFAPGKDVVEAQMPHAVRHVLHILRRDFLAWGPQPVLPPGEDHPLVPLTIVVAVVEGLGDLDLCRLADEDREEHAHRDRVVAGVIHRPESRPIR